MLSTTANYGQYSIFVFLDCKSAALSLNFWSFIEKCCTVPKKPLKTYSPEPSGPPPAWRFWRIGFLRFFRDSTALFNPRPKILGTVKHFCVSGMQKWCTVLDFLVPRHENLGTVQHFCSSGLQKCCNLGTVQHFCSSGLQKCCTVIIFVFSLKSAVLSLKKHQKTYSPEPSGPPKPEGSGE